MLDYEIVAMHKVLLNLFIMVQLLNIATRIQPAKARVFEYIKGLEYKLHTAIFTFIAAGALVKSAVLICQSVMH